jgi:hypothetical protein
MRRQENRGNVPTSSHSSKDGGGEGPGDVNMMLNCLGHLGKYTGDSRWFLSHSFIAEKIK